MELKGKMQGDAVDKYLVLPGSFRVEIAERTIVLHPTHAYFEKWAKGRLGQLIAQVLASDAFTAQHGSYELLVRPAKQTELSVVE